MATTLNDILFINAFVKEYGLSEMEDLGQTRYSGYIKGTDGEWYIVKETIAAGITTIRYARKTASGTNNQTYANAWTNRATLDYAYYNAVF